MSKFTALKIKNIADRRLFFVPFNRWVEEKALVDILALCDGDSRLAATVAGPYRNSPDWQVFEVYAGPLPSPEGTIVNVAAPEVPLAPVAPQEPPKKPKPEHKKKTEPTKAELGGDWAPLTKVIADQVAGKTDDQST